MASEVFSSPPVGRVAVQAFPAMGSKRNGGADSIVDRLNDIVLGNNKEAQRFTDPCFYLILALWILTLTFVT